MLNKIIDFLFVLGLLAIAGFGGAFWYYFKGDDRLTINEFQPQSQLITEEHLVKRARFPVFDTHIHLRGSDLSADEVIQIMNECNIEKLVNLDIYGLWGEELLKQIETYQKKYPKRIITTTNINFDNIGDPKYSEKAVAQLEESYRMGARAIKIWRNLGLHITDKDGKLIRVDDSRLDPVWKKAGELKMPVIFHTADASAFWKPVDKHNERFQELQSHHKKLGYRWGKYGPIFETLTGAYYKLSIMRHPERLYYQSQFKWFEEYLAFKEELIGQRDNVIRRHPGTTFIGAHIACSPEDLNFVAKELDEMPNFYLEMSHRIPELGRQPYTARKFFIKYQDRITFGLDGPPEVNAYQESFRFLETKDEYFDYPRVKTIPQGNWKIYGLGLPEEVLKKIYYENANRIFSHTYTN